MTPRALPLAKQALRSTLAVCAALAASSCLAIRPAPRADVRGSGVRLERRDPGAARHHRRDAFASHARRLPCDPRHDSAPDVDVIGPTSLVSVGRPPATTFDTRRREIIRPEGDDLDPVSRALRAIAGDHARFWSVDNLSRLGFAASGAALLAHSPSTPELRASVSMDVDIHAYVLDTFDGEFAEDFARDIEVVGDYTLTVPVLGLVAIGSSLLRSTSGGSIVSEWSTRSLRAILVGEPMLLLLQKATGGSRPSDGMGSRWRPLEDDNGASGHTFIGAVPFLAAASMTDRWYLRYPLILASMLPGWARMQGDDHYYSQVVLGWWLAYQSVQSVDGRRHPGPRGRRFCATPILLPDGVMLGLVIEF